MGQGKVMDKCGDCLGCHEGFSLSAVRIMGSWGRGKDEACFAIEGRM